MSTFLFEQNEKEEVKKGQGKARKAQQIEVWIVKKVSLILSRGIVTIPGWCQNTIREIFCSEF